MGCISSKVLTRSISLQHQMSIKFHRTTDSITKLDDLFTNSSKPALDSSNTGTTVNIWELLNKLEEQQQSEGEEEQEKHTEEEPNTHISKRSKSFHTFEEFNNIEADHDESMGKTRLRSRSFHTVEEFDALLEKLKGIEDGFPEQNKSENGVKRKAYAKGLTSLQIPSNVEFPNPGSLRKWLGGQVCSPGAYVTPKFGSYNITAPSSTGGSSSGEGSEFLSDLVASLEEGMQQMEDEEKLILEQIEGAEKEDMEARPHSALSV